MCPSAYEAHISHDQLYGTVGGPFQTSYLPRRPNHRIHLEPCGSFPRAGDSQRWGPAWHALHPVVELPGINLVIFVTQLQRYPTSHQPRRRLEPHPLPPPGSSIPLIHDIAAMSRTAKATFLGTTLLCGATVAIVHYLQKSEQAVRISSSSLSFPFLSSPSSLATSPRELRARS